MILLNQALCNKIVKGYFFGIQNKLSVLVQIYCVTKYESFQISPNTHEFLTFTILFHINLIENLFFSQNYLTKFPNEMKYIPCTKPIFENMIICGI